jgi:hypothetical protein
MMTPLNRLAFGARCRKAVRTALDGPVIGGIPYSHPSAERLLAPRALSMA